MELEFAPYMPDVIPNMNSWLLAEHLIPIGQYMTILSWVATLLLAPCQRFQKHSIKTHLWVVVNAYCQEGLLVIIYFMHFNLRYICYEFLALWVI